MFLKSINYFRGIAILFVVGGHSFAIGGVLVDSFPERVVGNLIAGGTFMFLFISGYLFHHHSMKHYDYPRFLWSKVTNLLLPYLALSLIPAILIVSRQGEDCIWCRPESQSWIDIWAIPLGRYLWSGRALLAYWFIPFAFLNYCLAPFHVWFSRRSSRLQVLILAVSAVIGMMAHKPILDMSPKQSLIYFAATYLFGIFCSCNRAKLLALLTGRELVLLGAAVGFAVLEAIQRTGTSFGNYHNCMFAKGPIDLMMPQKWIMSLFFMTWMNQFESREFPILNILAKTSFAVFFIHPLVIVGIGSSGFRGTTGISWVDYVGYFAALLVFSVLIALLTKKVMSKWSRYVIGW